jgi:hypothetical protein
MRLRSLLLWLSIAASLVGGFRAQAQPLPETAVTQARELVKALVALDAEKVVSLSAPKFRLAMGGEQNMLRTVNEQFGRGRAAGVVVESIELGQPTEARKDGSTLFLFIPYTAVARSKSQIVTDKAFYLALSEDQGQTWSFVDGIRLDAELLRYFLPVYAGEPAIPVRSRQVQPVEVPR